MRHNSQNNNRRHRSGGARHNNNGGNRGNGGGQNRMQVFDSNGPEVRIRGTAFQICEKYQALAKDAASQGDTVMAESYLQHAEHYQRVINSWDLENRQPHVPGHMSSDQPSHAPAPNQPQERTPEDDLGLPMSILGPKPQVSAQPEDAATVSRPGFARTDTMEDA